MGRVEAGSTPDLPRPREPPEALRSWSRVGPAAGRRDAQGLQARGLGTALRAVPGSSGQRHTATCGRLGVSSRRHNAAFRGSPRVWRCGGSPTLRCDVYVPLRERCIEMRVYRPGYTSKKGVKKKCKVWYVQTTVNGKRFRKSTGCKDRRSAIKKARELVLAAERLSAGLHDQLDVHQRRPLKEHLEDFEATLRARGVGEQYLADRMRCLRGFVSYAGCKRLIDLDDSSASRWLAEERGKGLSARTVNRRYQALRQFGRWLVKANRLERAPFTTLRPLNEQADRRRQRRSLSADELRLLFAAAKSRPLRAATRQRVRKGVTDAERRRLVSLGEVRAIVYQLAAGTGLRRNELRELRWRDLDLKAGWITVPAATAKSRKDQRVPLRTGLVQMLRAFRSHDARMRDRVIPPKLFPLATGPQAGSRGGRHRATGARRRVLGIGGEEASP